MDAWFGSINDGRGRYPDRISVHVPKGLRDKARDLAEGRGISLAEFVRRVLWDSLTDASHAANGKAQ